MDCNAEISIWAVREQLERIERSTEFVDSGRLKALLRHLVTESLAGNGATLREAMIGKVIYAREPTYNPRFDSTVRVEARRLGRKLQAYYARQDPLDRVRIELPTGGYVPVFSIIGDQPDAAVTVGALEAKAGSIFRAGPGVALAIMSSTALSPDTDTLIFADELTEELIFAMGQTEGLRVASRGVTFGYWNCAYWP